MPRRKQKIPFLIFSTTSNRKEAERIAQVLLEKRLAACINVVDSVKSFFWWQGKRQKAREVLLVIKTVRSLVPHVEKTIRMIHSYQVPEIIGWPITAGSKPYLRWIKDSTA